MKVLFLTGELTCKIGIILMWLYDTYYLIKDIESDKLFFVYPEHIIKNK
jgi:hypothetical protein